MVFRLSKGQTLVFPFHCESIPSIFVMSLFMSFEQNARY